MKKLFHLFSFLILLTTITILSCSKGNEFYKSRGVIYGIDPTMCGCCGGWLIKIEEVGYHFGGIPEDSNFNLIYDSLPISVRLDWQLINDGCPSSMKWIAIQRIKKE